MLVTDAVLQEAPESPATAVLLLSAEGTVLARSGPPAMLGPPRRSIGYADLPEHFRAEGGEDLLAMVKLVANASPGGPRTVRVLPERSGWSHPILLTLHHVAAGLVVGVLSDGPGAPKAPSHLVQLRTVWDDLSEGVAVATLDDGGHLEGIVECNDAFAAMFGALPGDLAGQPLARYLAPWNGPVFEQRVEEEVARGGRPLSDLTTPPRGTGRQRTLLSWDLSPLRSEDGRVLGAVVVVREAAGAERSAPAKRSELDPSSGLPNEAHFLSRLERSVERAAQPRAYTFAVIGLEMRGLRAVERRLGPLVANTALEAFVRRVEQRLRPTDLVARTGDRRLAVLLDQFAPWGALEDVVERIRVVADAPYTIGGERVTMTTIGAPGPVWSGEGPSVEAQDVLSRLDVAVTRARSGSGPKLRERARRSGEVGELAAAVQRSQLTLRYLPLVSPEDGRVVAMEALVQWPRPKHGVVPGGMFVHQAERHGLIRAVGEWVWGEALRHVREWDASLAPGQVPPVHLNLSLSEFWHPALVEELKRRAAEAGIVPSRIRLEIPEAAIARRAHAARIVLDALGEAGFEPWLDRFGEGGTQLTELDSLPFRHAKLVAAVAWSANGSAGRPRPSLGSLLAFAHDLGWRVAVGGVERREQADALRKTACDLAQGFFYHGLLDPSQAAALLRQSTGMEADPTKH